MDIQEVLPLYPVESEQQTEQNNIHTILEIQYLLEYANIFPNSPTFHWFVWWVSRDIAPSRVHLMMECQVPHPVLAILLLVAPRSEDAPASSLPAPQWSESPGHQIHLGRNTGKMNNQAFKAECRKWSISLLIHLGC